MNNMVWPEGCEVFLVGGAVRDKLLGLKPKDLDWVIVGAEQSCIEERLLRAGFTQVGADFPVFLHPTTGDQYALARTERKTGVGYHGFDVAADATVTLEQDLCRRDLTINSMAMSSTGELIDPYGGLKDLRNHVLRHTSPAFSEDPLRVLRLARFDARFKDFRVAAETRELCKALAESGELNNLATERIWTEVENGLREKHPAKFFEALDECGALEHCTILRTAFGSSLTAEQRKVCVVLETIKPADRLAVGVAALSPRLAQAEELCVSKRVMDCYQNIQLLLRSRYTAQAFAKVLKCSGALREGPSFNDMCLSAAVLELAGHAESKFTPRQLWVGVGVYRRVRSAQFQQLTGKELGTAIDQARVHNLHVAMGIPELCEVSAAQNL